MTSMQQRCRQAAVLGAGVMGTGIAAYLAAAGIRTHLLDIVPSDAKGQKGDTPERRNALSLGAIEKAKKSKPATFFAPDEASRIVCGNFEDNLDVLSACDLVIEAVTERLDIKQSLFRTVASKLSATAVLATNTSGLPLKKMAEALPPELSKRFVAMHFFNPVRYMPLVEVVPGPQTLPEVVTWAVKLGERLGKGVVVGKDTPNFIANRIGVFAMMHALHAMDRAGLTIEAVDKVLGKPACRPASATFRTGDLVGIDTLVHVANNCLESLTDDAARDVFQTPGWVQAMVSDKRLGQKTGAGFYKKVGRDILVWDVASGSYRAAKEVEDAGLAAAKGARKPAERIVKLLAQKSPLAEFAWENVANTLAYAAGRVGEIADDVISIDRAMRWGFNWELGPFEMWDALGVEATCARMKASSIAVPAWVGEMLGRGQTSFYGGEVGAETQYLPKTQKAQRIPQLAEAISLAAIRQTPSRVVRAHESAHLLDVGEGVFCLEMHTRMNVIDPPALEVFAEAVSHAEQAGRALIIANQGEHFGAGFNLQWLMKGLESGSFGSIEEGIRTFQAATQRFYYAQVPVVAAPFGFTLGGACEVAMSAHACQAYAESYMGLVEVGVGLIPAGGGCLRLAERASARAKGLDPVDMLNLISGPSMQVAQAQTSASAQEARDLGYLTPADGITFNKDRLLYDAKARAIGLAESSFLPRAKQLVRVAGQDGYRTLGMRIWSMVEGKHASAYDGELARRAAYILCGGNVSAGSFVTPERILELELEAFLSLCGQAKTQARVKSLLETGAHLRN